MPSQNQKQSILIVDDSRTNIDVLAQILKANYRLLIALDAEKALTILQKNEAPDLIILDVIMPGMSGYELCEQLKKDPKLQHIPVIFVTAMSEIEDETKGFELGAVDFITKPYSPSIVTARVKTQLALKEARDAMEGFSKKLSRYVSPQVKESILSGQQSAQLGSSRKKLTVFFSDIVGFTRKTDRLEPEDLTYILNSYLNRMADIALKHGGTVDKFIGDAVLVFFGDPESRGVQQDALACVTMAIEMQAEIQQLSRQWSARGIAIDFEVRMGMTTGYCTVGNFGSETHMDYTIIGNPVNLASRLETHAAPNSILITEDTYELIKGRVHCTPAEPIHAKGLSDPVPVYNVKQRLEQGTDNNRYFEATRAGFSLSLDLNKILPQDKARILNQLQAAQDQLK